MSTFVLFLFMCTSRRSSIFIWSNLNHFFRRGNSKLESGNFILSDMIDEREAVLEKYAFSNALCLSGENLHFNYI